MRIKIIFLLCIVHSALKLYSQNFEGEIIYENSYRSKIPNLTDAKLSSLLGTKQEYFISGGNYKSVVNGLAVTMQLYDYKTNRIYNKTPNSDTLYWIDASMNMDSISNYEIKKNALLIMGYECDALILQTKTGTATFYFSKRLGLDGDKYKNHNYGNWSFYTANAGSLPLKMVIENNNFRMESTVIEIKPLKLDKEYFDIDGKLPVKKSF